MLKIEVIYNHRKKSVEIWANGDECGDIAHLQNKEIPLWFQEYSDGKLSWKGLIAELEELFGYSVQNMEFDFQGDEDSRKIFIQCLNQKNISIAKPKVEPPSELLKNQGLENGKLLEKAGKIDEAKEQYKISADLGNIEACYHYGRLSVGVESVNYYRISADGGYGAAQCSLATCYKTGNGVPKDENVAFSLYQKASEQPEAQYHLAMYYMKGMLVSKNLEKSKELLEKAAESAVVLAELELGNCYFKGLGTTVNKEVAVSWWQKSAQKGNMKAKYFLALCYLKGLGVSENKTLALALLEESSELMESKGKLGEILLESSNLEQGILWLEQAMEQGHLPSKMKLIKCYYEGLGVTKNYDKVIEIYESTDLNSLESPEYAQYHFILGECHFYGYGISINKEMAHFFYELSAKYNYSPALLKLGELKQAAMNVNVGKDIKKSVEWYEQAAEQGNIEAMLELAKLYKNREDDDLKRKDSRKHSFFWYERAAKLGNIEGQFQVGNAYYKSGKQGGTEKNRDQAVLWFEKAAIQGHREAQFRLAQCFYKGKGMEDKDKKAAFDWFMKAADQGHKEAQEEVLYCLNRGKGVGKDKEKAKQLGEKWRESELAYKS